MPRFSPNMANESLSILLPRGEFEFSIGEGKPFSRNKEKDGVTTVMWGVIYSLKVTGSTNSDEDSKKFIGKNIPLSLYMHGENTGNLNKQFAMAGHGFTPTTASETEFNAKFPSDDDWYVDTEANAIGEGWKSLAGKRVRAIVDQKVNKNDATQMNNQFKWLPF
jgi:hypothetical protein